MSRTSSLASIVLAGLLILVPGSALGTMSDAPGAAVDDLLAHIPASHRDACRPDLPDDLDDALMSVTCDLPSGITVRYSQMPSADVANARYEDRRVLKEVERDSGDCAAGTPGEQGYTIGGEPAGRLLCYEALGYDTFEWTNDATDIYALALLGDDPGALWTWWLNESGPLVSPVDVSDAGVGAAVDALLSRVPEGHRETCRPFDGGGPEDGVVASLRCVVSPDITVYYSQHDSAETLEADYRSQVEKADLEPDTGDCSVALPGEQGYVIGDELAGRLLCTGFFDGVWFDWTYEPSAISGTISSDLDLAATWDWWLNESGPTPATPSSEASGSTGSIVDQQRLLFSSDLALGLVNGRFDGAGAPPIDDAYAVGLAAASDRFDIRGLVITHGNAIMAPELAAAIRLVDTLDLDVPVVAGAAVPLANPGVSWFDGAPLDEWCLNDGVEHMARELREAPATVLAIGPLTDVACLVINHPDAAANIERIVALLGARPGTELELGGTPVPDLNFTTDPIALQVVLEQSDIPFTAMTFEVTKSVDFDIDRLVDAADAGNPAAIYYHAASVPNTSQFDSTSFEIFDVHTVNWLLDPAAYACEEGGYELRVGQPAVVPTPQNDDRFGPGLPGRTVTVCSAFSDPSQADRLNDELLSAIEALGD